MNDHYAPDPAQSSAPKSDDLKNNNDIQELDAAEDGSVQSIGAEGSAGSDTEAGKIDSADGNIKDLAEIHEQSRPNAVKKSTTFKPVSVTKNFLAKTGTPTNPATKASSDKGKFRTCEKPSSVKLIVGS